MRCKGKVIKCNDPTCKEYNQHYTCEGHPLHYGDVIQQIDTKWKGYITEPNPWGSRRSVGVTWFANHFDEGKYRSGKLFVGHAACTQIEKLDEPRRK